MEGRSDAEHHAVAYTTAAPPDTLVGERIMRHAIRIAPERAEFLRSTSRINFSRMCAVDHCDRVKSIGKVVEDWMPWVEHYFRESSEHSTREVAWDESHEELSNIVETLSIDEEFTW